MKISNLLSIADAAEVLGISEATCREAVRRGTIPAVRLTSRFGRIYIPRPALEDWLNQARFLNKREDEN